MALTPTTSAWLHGLASAAITSFSTAASGMLMLPTVFNVTSENGWINIVKIVLVPTGIAVFAYLKASPLPGTQVLAPNDKVDLQNPVIMAGSITADSAVVTKATVSPAQASLTGSPAQLRIPGMPAPPPRPKQVS